MIIAGLILLGLGLGSFVNALVWRIYKDNKSKKYSIVHGRSMCPDCKHELKAADLIPILSWMRLKGKCRYCRKPISWQYPAVELTTALLFVLSYVFWPVKIEGWEWFQFLIWLVCLTGFMALIVYDFRYMILPNKIIFPLIVIAAVGAVTESIYDASAEPLKNALLGLLVGGGIFYLLFVLSNGAWIGGGDVKLGFLLGILLGGAGNAFLMLFVASLLGTLATLPLIVSKRLTPKNKIPFGPFLIVGGIIAKLFGESIIDWYTNSIL